MTKMLQSVSSLLFPSHRLAACCSLMAMLEVTMFLLKGGFRGERSIGLLSGFVALIILSWMSLAWLLHWAVVCVERIAATPRRVKLLNNVISSLFFLYATIYVCSLGLFWRTGEFIDFDTVRFVFLNARMLILYFLQTEKLSLLFLPCCSLIFLRLFSQSLRQKSILDNRKTVWKGLLVVWLTTNAVGLLIWYEPHDSSGAPWSQWTDSRRVLRYRTSPLFTLCTSLWETQSSELQEDLTVDQLGPLRHAETKTPELLSGRPQTSVILIAIESLRHDVIHAFHQNREIMPHVNRLPRQGRWFQSAYSQSTHSNYADPCLVSSLYPLRSARQHHYSRLDLWPKVLLYDALKDYGYRTAIFSSQNEEWGNMETFLQTPKLDVFFDSRQVPAKTYCSEMDTGFWRFVKDTKAAGKLDDTVTMGEACKWIRAQQPKPFCIYLNLQSSHFPYHVPETEKPFQPCKFDFPASFGGYPEDKVDIVRNAYFNALHYIDKQVGQLMEQLTELKLKDNTLIIVAGDNGEAFYENGYPTHAGLPYQPAIHVALVMHCPQVLKPATDPNITQAIDIPPTVLGLLGIRVPDCFQGNDVLSQVVDIPEMRLAFIHCENGIAGSEAVVLGGGWKLIKDRRNGSNALYHLPSDPGEKKNLVDKEPEIAAILLRLVKTWRTRQLSYYQLPKHYQLHFPPPTPTISPADMVRLTERGNSIPPTEN